MKTKAQKSVMSSRSDHRNHFKSSKSSSHFHYEDLLYLCNQQYSVHIMVKLIKKGYVYIGTGGGARGYYFKWHKYPRHLKRNSVSSNKIFWWVHWDLIQRIFLKTVRDDMMGMLVKILERLIWISPDAAKQHGLQVLSTSTCWKVLWD